MLPVFEQKFTQLEAARGPFTDRGPRLPLQQRVHHRTDANKDNGLEPCGATNTKLLAFSG